MWDLFVSSGQYYLIHIYRMDNGYIGAYLRCETILNELVSGKKSAEAAAILGENNEVIITNEGGINDVSTISFTEKLYYTNYQIGLCVSKTQLYSKRSYIVGITTGAVLLGLVIFSISMRVMLKRIFLPLVNLRVGMETFSEGNMDIRLDENVENNEVRILYKTFNHMAEDIKDLKIGIYEAMIEKQRIQSSYLRVQIQPHFYTNILNLIYNFAEVEDYQGIQNLLLYTSRYFRYLLKDKGDFVELAWEIECVENFVNIQKIRYPGMLEIEIKNSITYPIEIPPLLIQTFIENSVKHNITLVPKVLIFVHIRQQEERLLITIEDTGVGFEKNLLAKINMNAELEENGKHIGIVNIKRRLEYLYRGSAKVLVDNTKSGAAIYIEVPVNHEREV